jgi:CRP-like cAMP-binding protein
MKRSRTRAPAHREALAGAGAGPSLRARPFFRHTGSGAPAELLSESQRRRLAAIATVVRLPPRKIIYHEHDVARWIFICSEGVLKAFRELRSGKRRIAAFLFPGDMFGIAENGRYVNAIRTIIAVTLHRIEADQLSAALRHDPDLQAQVLIKVTHELRESQRRAIIIGRRDAAGRFAMFLAMLEAHPSFTSGSGIIRIAMSRSDIADYLGLSLEALSRATSRLTREGIIAFEDRHTVRVLDPKALARLAEEV